MTREAIFNAIIEERLRQVALKFAGKFEYTCADMIGDFNKLAILVEEVGEVARDICEDRDVRTELIQCAAVICAWLESID